MTAALLDISKALHRGRILRRARQDQAKLGFRLVQPIELQKSPSERDASRQVPGMDAQSNAADVDGLAERSGAAALLGELRKCHRRRVLLDPASKVVNPRIVEHRP